MAVRVPCGYGVEGYRMGVVIIHLASHPARCLWPSTASAGDAFSACAIKEPNRWLFFTGQQPDKWLWICKKSFWRAAPSNAKMV